MTEGWGGLEIGDGGTGCVETDHGFIEGVPCGVATETI